MIVRLLLWRLDETAVPFEELRARIDALEPLASPSAWLWNEPQERFGVLLVDEEGDVPPQLDHVRALLGRDPDLFEEFDAVA